MFVKKYVGSVLNKLELLKIAVSAMAMGGATQVIYVSTVELLGNGGAVAAAIVVAVFVYGLSLWLTKAVVRMICIISQLSVSVYKLAEIRRKQSYMKNNTKEPVSVQPLVAVVKALRAPNGCPWDQKQTHESLRRYFIEETYEVVDAIDIKICPIFVKN